MRYTIMFLNNGHPFYFNKETLTGRHCRPCQSHTRVAGTQKYKLIAASAIYKSAGGYFHPNTSNTTKAGTDTTLHSITPPAWWRYMAEHSRTQACTSVRAHHPERNFPWHISPAVWPPPPSSLPWPCRPWPRTRPPVAAGENNATTTSTAPSARGATSPHAGASAKRMHQRMEQLKAQLKLAPRRKPHGPPSPRPCNPGCNPCATSARKWRT